jgi:hypothetical protein
LTEGAHALTATATDAAGNTGPASSAANVTVDVTPPVTPTINPVTTPTKVSPQVITGGKSTDSVTVWVNGTTTGVTYPTATTWSYSLSLSEGANPISVTARDAAGNTSTAANSSITLDTVAPVAPTISAPSLTNNTNVAVTGSAEANSTVKVYEGVTLKATIAANGSGSWNTTVSLTEGAHALTATATDAAGNTGPASTAANVTVDVTPPVTPTINPVTTPTKVSPQTITGGKSTDSVTVWVNGTTTGVTYPTPTTWSYSLSLSEGANPVNVTAKDAAGNTSTAANTSITLDSISPAAISSLASTDRGKTSITLGWTSPGDDVSSGTATSYDVRYSTSPITDANWNSATEATGEPAPQVAGSSETFLVTGLSPATTYYFAVKTEDEIPNWSTLSNVVSRSTLLLGDVNRDGAVSLVDLAVLAAAYGSRPGDANWNQDADLNNDGRVSLTDLAILAADYGKSV